MRPFLRGAAFLLLLTVLVPAPVLGAGLPPVGGRAPAFSLPELGGEGRPVSSGEVFRDRLTMISFFATWCEPCKRELGELRQLSDRYGSRGFQVVLVCLDLMGLRNVKPYLEEAGALGLRVLSDRKGEASALYGVMHLPTNVLVGSDGVVLASWDTYRPERLQELEGRLARLPARKAP